MNGWTCIAAGTLTVSPWRNGRGTSRTIATRHGADGGMLWQVGIADLAEDGPFSDYPHMDRIFTPIAGDPPPALAFHGGPFEPCRLLTPRAFPGDVPTLSRIPAPGQAFNVIVDRRHHQAEVTVRHLAAGDPIALPGAPVLLLHCLVGQMSAAGLVAQAGDSLLAAAPIPDVGTHAVPDALMGTDGTVLLVAIT